MNRLTDHLHKKKSMYLKFVDEFEKESKIFTTKPNIMKRLAKKYPEYFEGIDTDYPYQIYYNFETSLLKIKITGLKD